MTDIKGSKKDHYISSKSQTMKMCSFLLSGAGDLLAKDMEKVDILNALLGLQ